MWPIRGFIYLFKMFIYFEREMVSGGGLRERERGRDRKGEKERIPSRLRANSTNREIMHDLSPNQESVA